MELALGSKYLKAELSGGCDKHGQEYLLVVVKGSWSFGDGKSPRPIAAQALHYADVHVEEPGISAPLYESDFALYKPRCDVILQANAHAPQPVTELVAGFRIGALEKFLRVTGARVWQKQNGQYQPSAPHAFTVMPLHYGNAYGGSWPGKTPDEVQTFLYNPVGSGFCQLEENAAEHADPQDLPLPCLQAIDQAPPEKPDQAIAASALSPIARHWLPRREYGGTYDAAWQRDVFPFLPQDFDDRFHQCAPIDQQMDYPQGGEEVLLYNLVRGQSECRFVLPRLNKLPVRVLMGDYRVIAPPVVADTLFIEPEHQRFSVVWRAKVPVKHLQDVKTVAVAGICKGWWDAKISGAQGCINCAKQRSTQEAAPSEEECAKESA